MSEDRKRRWDDHPAAPTPGAPGEGGEPASKAVKTEEGATAGGQGGVDKAHEAAAAIAARLSASLASGAITGRPSPPSSAPPPPPGDAPPPPPPSGFLPPGEGGGVTSVAAQNGMRAERDRDREAGLFVEDIEINDLRNRYLLTKGPTQQQILADTGAAVLTKGVWYPDKSMATEKDPPLYLHITAEFADKLALGVAAVRALIDQDLQLLAAGQPPGRVASGDSGWGGRRKWPEEKIPIDLEPLRTFNIRAKTVGPGGLFVKYIQQETQTRVQIKGVGSGYIETETGREADEPIHVHITGPDAVMNAKAADMARDLLEVVREKHAEAKKAIEEQQRQYNAPVQPAAQQLYGQPMRFPGLGQTGGGSQDGQNPYSYQANQYAGAGLTAPLPPGEAPPPPPPSGGDPAAGATNSAQAAGTDPSGQMSTEAYAAWWASLDDASRAYYTQYYAAYAQYTANPAPNPAYSAAAQTPGAPPPPPPSSAPPPPPPSDAPPPPPPPPTMTEEPKGGKGAYGAVPPPAGL
ncbi:hypothetical protein JCM8547_001466 [Rhodosporidiobolus lusitaniae]